MIKSNRCHLQNSNSQVCANKKNKKNMRKKPIQNKQNKNGKVLCYGVDVETTVEK